MKRNRLAKLKIEGWWIFLAVGILISCIVFVYAQDEDVETYKEEELPKPVVFNYEESANSQIGHMEKEIHICQEEVLGMGARIAYLDKQHEIQDALLLGKVIYAECRGEPEEGQIAVVNVILNRRKAPKKVYPNSIEEVVFDRRFNTIQFSCAHEDKEIWSGGRIVEEADITEDLEEAVAKALAGENTIGDRMNFHVYTEECNHPNQKVIENHVFY